MTNIGTTMTEAVDDVLAVHRALDDAGITHRYVHSDAALAGIPLASAPGRPAFDLSDGADSISISGHKFLGTPLVCGVVLARRGPKKFGSWESNIMTEWHNRYRGPGVNQQQPAADLLRWQLIPGGDRGEQPVEAGEPVGLLEHVAARGSGGFPPLICSRR